MTIAQVEDVRESSMSTDCVLPQLTSSADYVHRDPACHTATTPATASRVVGTSSRFQGDIGHSGEKSGHGTFTWPDGAEYTGEFLNDKRHGLGTQVILLLYVYLYSYINLFIII